MKKNDSVFKKIKKALAIDDVLPAIEYLNSADNTSILDVFKEQRLLLIPTTTEELYEKYLQRAKALLQNEKSYEYELNYIQFLKAYRHDTAEIKTSIDQLLKGFSHFDLKSFFFTVNIHLEKFLESAHEDLTNSLANNNLSQSADEISAHTEFAYNILKGRINDAMFAQTNLVNHFAKISKEVSFNANRNNLNDNLANDLIIAFNLASRLNCYQYALDQVSCLEWFVEKVYKEVNELLIFEFSIIDPLFQKAREIGLQRILSQKIIGRQKSRWLSNLVRNIVIEIFEFACNYYQEENNILLTSNKIFDKNRELLILNLDLLDAEDELLIAASDPDSDIFDHYIAAAALTAFTFAADSFKQNLTKKAFIFTYPVLPIDQIKKIISGLRIGNKSFNPDVVDLYICSLPIVRHLDLFSQPFIREKNQVFAVENLVIDAWVSNTRVKLMQGGKTADLVGRTWEKYIAGILRSNKWPNVIEGVKVKKNGTTLTDIDILAKREDTLLLIQLKVYYGTGLNNYEQWKFKKKLEHAAQQVKHSEEAIRSESILKNHFTLKEIAEIKRIKSVIMTNSHYYNGWEFDGIKIMSVDSLMQIINGASVKFTTQDGTILHEKKYAKTRELTINEFLDFIDKPLDWRIGSQNYTVTTHTEEFDTLIFKFPILRNDISNIN